VHVELEARARPGPYKVTVRPERWANAIFSARPLAASRMLARAVMGPEMLLDGVELAVRSESIAAEHLLTWAETVPPASCLQAVVGVEGNGGGVELRAFEGTDDEVDRSEAAYATAVRACAPGEAARIVRFELRAAAGRLDAVVGERLFKP
jgi:hypothetical protein